MPPSLGKKLQQAREQLGLSLPDVAHKTRIPVAKLQDLEADAYDTFGSLTYARCFLQTYAGFVGVDSNSVTDHMNPAPLSAVRDQHYLTESLGRWIGVKPGPSQIPDARPVQSSKASTVVLAVFGTVLIGGALWAKAYFNEHKAPVVESRKIIHHEVNQNRSSNEEEVRPAIPARVIVTDNVRVRKALPVEDEPKTMAKK
ncbi:MAG: helix-turn-helix domain-containing protein [Verrucomicrobia bacterium]|nr:helix-turn-helix domain-containing protein [Verrucomicrobiota bacterium]